MEVDKATYRMGLATSLFVMRNKKASQPYAAVALKFGIVTVTERLVNSPPFMPLGHSRGNGRSNALNGGQKGVAAINTA